MTASLDLLWRDYCEGGMGLGEISLARGMSYGTVRNILTQHPDYAELAAMRRQEAPREVREALLKQIDVPEALGLLRAGQGTRAVAQRYHVCTRTLRKRLLRYPEYQQIMAARGVSKPSGEDRPTSA